MSKHLGDYDASAVIYGKFTTYRPSTGASFTLGGTPALSVYKDNSVTQSTTGVTLTADFDSVTGLNHFAIDTSADGTFYAAGSFFDIVITTGTVDSVSVTGSVVASFTIRKDSSLKPTVAARTLDVSAGGEAGVDWANVGSPTTSLALTGTTIAITQKVDVDTIKTNPVVNAGTVTFPTTATLASTTNITAGTITTTTNLTNLPSIPANWITAAGITAAALNGKGDWNVGKTGYALTATTGLGNQTSNITGSLSGSVGSVTGAVGSVTGNVGGNVTGSVGSVTGLTNATIADAVWDEDATAHQTQGTFGQAIGDPGADTDTIFGLVNTNLDAAVSTRLSTAGYTAPDNTSIAAILVDTAEIGVAGAGLTNINLPDQTMNITGDITGNLSGSVGSVTGAVGSVTGNVGGSVASVVGAVGSVTGLTAANLDVAVSTRMATYTQPTGFLAATFPLTVASTTNITAGTITTVTNLTNAPTSGDLTATMKASVNTEVLDVLNTDTFAEPGQEAPPATTTLVKKIGYIYKMLRNKITQTSTTLSVFADDATTVDQKATVSDDGTTYTRGEIGSGP